MPEGPLTSDEPSHDTLEVRCAPARGPWSLEVGSVGCVSARLLRAGDRLVLGSSQQSDVRVSDPTVSHRHCAIRVCGDGVEIEDLSSKNGLYVGAVRVRRATVLSESAAFVIGRTSVVVRSGQLECIPEGDPPPGLIGGSLGMQQVFAEIRRHARTRAPVLLQGESGTGKDVLARALHRLSRRSGAYVPLNVGALPESLADAELFGHRRGAFTGAVHSRPGAFEQAHGGTLFLDEIADLAPSVQVKLLRVVEDGLVRPLGATSTTRVDVRLVSASWADLERRVEEGTFRADLYHRLSTVIIGVPPLRQRKSDLPALAAALLKRIRDDVGEKHLSGGALSRLVSYAWPGNVRELGSVLYRAAMLSPDPEIGAEHVALGSGDGALPRRTPLGEGDARALLAEHGGNVSRAARAARVPRSTFRFWLARAADRGSIAESDEVD